MITRNGWSAAAPLRCRILLLLFTIVGGAGSCVAPGPVEPPVLGLELDPPPALAGTRPAAGMPFHQAVPLPPGALTLPDGMAVPVRAAGLAGQGRRVTMWPDGSVQWLFVSGALDGRALPRGPLRAQVGRPLPTRSAVPAGPVTTVVAKDNAILLKGADGQTLFRLTPSASMFPVQLPVHVGRDDPDYLDEEGQYLWAAERPRLHPDAEPVALDMILRDSVREDAVSGKRGSLFRGEGLHPQVAGRLEWQLRVELSEGSPAIRLDMTWSAFWNEQEWALAGAAWAVDTENDWRSVESGGGIGDRLDGTAWALGSRHNGETFRGPSGDLRDAPAGDWVVLDGDKGFLGIACPRFTRLGPNRIQVEGRRIEIRSWDADSGRALDLRRTGADDEFNIASLDLRSRPLGLSRTVEATLFPGSGRQEVLAAAAALAARDDQWLPRAEVLVGTGALGPIRPDVLRVGADYLEGLRANLHFLRASQERWRWYGFVTYGDVRTNFAVGRNEARALFPLRWALSGRYGWRNASGDVPYRMLCAGLLLDDREIALMALDYARHVADVDLSHPPHFGEPQEDAGGFHRRNRDHWSGSVQMQYSPGNGVYLASWLTGAPRLRDALSALRDYAARDGGRSSALAAQAWINRYRETHRAEDLAAARALLDAAADGWRERSEAGRPGLEALYDGNFRWLSDGVQTLIVFYEGTGDPAFREAIHRILLRERDGGQARPSLILAAEGVMGYLVGAGLDPGEIGAERVEEAREYIRTLVPSGLPDRGEWTYDRLVEVVTRDLPGAPSPAHRESNAIGGRAFNAFFAWNLLAAPDPSRPAPFEDAAP